jgi:hypothetical protein
MKHKSLKAENRLILKYFLAATLGMLVMGLVHVLCKFESSAPMLFIPWMLCGMLLIPVAYRQGVKEGQQSSESSDS